MVPEPGSSSNPETVQPRAHGFGSADGPNAAYDANLRLTLAMIENSEWGPLVSRTGIDCFSGKSEFLSLFIQLDLKKAPRTERRMLDVDMFFKVFELLVPEAYARESLISPHLRTIAGRIELASGDPKHTKERGTNIADALDKITKSGFVHRLRLAVPHGKCLEQSLKAIDFPLDNVYKHHLLTGKNIVIGIIDDGCAFAHADFVNKTVSGNVTTYNTRVAALWDQSQPSSTAVRGWKDVGDFGYGREIFAQDIDEVLAAHSSDEKIDEDAVYEALDYHVGAAAERATHGTEVMGIAAGNGHSRMGWHGVAWEADIIFVQLPPDTLNDHPQQMSDKIAHAVAYIFHRAESLPRKAAVVNISYGGYSGAHDGTTGWEMAVDDLLREAPNRAVVVSAGNGFEADCHSMGTLQPGQEQRLHWIMKPADLTPNDLELWYTGSTTLNIWLSTPDGSKEFGPYGFCAQTDMTLNGAKIGAIEHVHNDPDNGDNSALIAMAQTAAAVFDTSSPPLAPAGTWSIRLRNTGSKPAEFHAWIRRDDVAKLKGARQQSRFAPEDAYPGYTIGDFASGELTVSVGAFNTATDALCAYSACGPTRSSIKRPVRQKPAVCAPGAELATGGGVMTSGSRQAAPRRLSGTSAAAPHVTGIVALMFDYRLNHLAKNLAAAEILTALATNSGLAPLLPDARQAIDDRRKVKQRDVWANLIGSGKISATKTLDNI